MRGIVAILLLLVLFLGTGPVSAHQPRIVSEQTVVEIKKPDVSQAFYAVLQGKVDDYQIKSEKEFNLYVSLLVPDLPGIRKDYLLEVCRVNAGEQFEKLFKLSGSQHNWVTFYEPFAGDNYFQGPESERVLPAGVYRLRVSNPDNKGKYVLSVGRQERYTLSEAVQTIKRLPSVKRYFEKSPWTAYFNLTGLFMVLSLLVLAVVVFVIYRITTRYLF